MLQITTDFDTGTNAKPPLTSPPMMLSTVEGNSTLHNASRDQLTSTSRLLLGSAAQNILAISKDQTALADLPQNTSHGLLQEAGAGGDDTQEFDEEASKVEKMSDTARRRDWEVRESGEASFPNVVPSIRISYGD